MVYDIVLLIHKWSIHMAAITPATVGPSVSATAVVVATTSVITTNVNNKKKILNLFYTINSYCPLNKFIVHFLYSKH